MNRKRESEFLVVSDWCETKGEGEKERQGGRERGRKGGRERGREGRGGGKRANVTGKMNGVGERDKYEIGGKEGGEGGGQGRRGEKEQKNKKKINRYLSKK